MGRGSAKPNKQKKRAAYVRSQKPAEEADPSTDTEQQLPDVVEGDAAQDASEPEEETQNPELDIEIATGRRYALIAKNLDVVTAASAERSRTATHKLVCELYGSPLPLLDHVCDGKPTGAIEIMVEDQAILKPEERRVLDGCNVIRLSLDEAKSCVVVRSTVNVLDVVSDTEKLSAWSEANGGHHLCLLFEAKLNRYRVEEAEKYVALGWTEDHSKLTEVAAAAVKAGVKLKVLKVYTVGGHSCLQITGVGVVRPTIGSVNLRATARIWLHGGDPEETEDESELFNRALVKLTGISRVERATGVRETNFEVVRAIVEYTADKAMQVKKVLNELHASAIDVGFSDLKFAGTVRDDFFIVRRAPVAIKVWEGCTGQKAGKGGSPGGGGGDKELDSKLAKMTGVLSELAECQSQAATDRADDLARSAEAAEAAREAAVKLAAETAVSEAKRREEDLAVVREVARINQEQAKAAAEAAAAHAERAAKVEEEVKAQLDGLAAGLKQAAIEQLKAQQEGHESLAQTQETVKSTVEQLAESQRQAFERQTKLDEQVGKTSEALQQMMQGLGAAFGRIEMVESSVKAIGGPRKPLYEHLEPHSEPPPPHPAAGPTPSLLRPAIEACLTHHSSGSTLDQQGLPLSSSAKGGLSAVCGDPIWSEGDSWGGGDWTEGPWGSSGSMGPVLVWRFRGEHRELGVKFAASRRLRRRTASIAARAIMTFCGGEGRRTTIAVATIEVACVSGVYSTFYVHFYRRALLTREGAVTEWRERIRGDGGAGAALRGEPSSPTAALMHHGHALWTVPGGI